MPNQPDFTTAGSAVADTLQDILTRRTVEKRQSFLDALNQQNMQHDWAYKDQQASSLADERAANAEQRRHQSTVFDEQEQDRRDATTRQHGQDAALNAILTSKEFAGLPPLNQMAVRAMIAQGKAPAASDFTAAATPPQAPRYKINNLTGAAEPILGPDGKPLMGPQNAPFEKYGVQPERPSSDPNDVFGSYDVPTGNKNPDGTPEVLHTFTSPRLLHDSNPGQITNTPGIRIMGGGPVHKGNEQNAPPKKPISTGSAGAFQKLTSLLAAGNDPMDAGVQAARAQAVSSLVDPVFKQDVSHYIQRRESGVPITANYVHQTLQAPPGTDPQQYENAVTTLLHASGIF